MEKQLTDPIPEDPDISREVISWPKDGAEVSGWDTDTIIKCMEKIQWGYKGFSDYSPEAGQEKFGLLSAEFKKRVEDYVVPEEFMEAARTFVFHPKGETESEYKDRFRRWMDLRAEDERYDIAALFNSAELPINSHNKQELIRNAREFVRRYLRHQAKVPEFWKG